MKKLFRSMFEATEEPFWLLQHIVKGGMNWAPFVWVFTRNIPFTVAGMLVGGGVAACKRNPVQRRRSAAIQQEFKEILQTIAGMTSADVTLSQALLRVPVDIQERYGDEGRLLQPFQAVANELETGASLNQAVDHLEMIEEDIVHDFIAVVQTSHQYGRGFDAQIYKLITRLEDRFTIEDDMRVQTAEKNFEQMLLFWIGLGLLEVLIRTIPELMAPLYATIIGRGALLISLALIGYGRQLSKQIVEVQI